MKCSQPYLGSTFPAILVPGKIQTNQPTHKPTTRSSVNTFPLTREAAGEHTAFCCMPRRGQTSGPHYQSKKASSNQAHLLQTVPSLLIFVIGNQSHTRPEIWIIKLKLLSLLLDVSSIFACGIIYPADRVINPRAAKRISRRDSAAGVHFPSTGWYHAVSQRGCFPHTSENIQYSCIHTRHMFLYKVSIWCCSSSCFHCILSLNWESFFCSKSERNS